MNYLEFDLNGLDTKELTAKLSFDIATSRASGFPLIKFVFNELMGDKFKKALTARLRDMKKNGRIELFASSDDFLNKTTGAEYLLNKFPTLKDQAMKESDIYFYVRI